MTNWSVFIKCAILLFILIVFSILSGIYLPKESFTSTSVEPNPVSTNGQMIPPVQTPLSSLLFSIPPMWTILKPLSQKIDEYKRPIQEETAWIKQRKIDAQTAYNSVKQIESELIALRPSLIGARTNMFNTRKQVNDLRRQINQTNNSLMREPNVLKQGELRQQVAELTPQLNAAVNRERQERQILQPLQEKRSQLWEQRQAILPELTTSVSSRAEMKRRTEMLESYKTAQALLITEYANQEKVLLPAYHCLHMLASVAELINMIKAMGNLTAEQYTELAGRKPTVLSEIVQYFKDIDVMVSIVANFPELKLVMNKDTDAQDSVFVNQLFLSRMKELGLVPETEPTTMSATTTQPFPIDLYKIQMLGKTCAIMKTKDPMLIRGVLERHITEPVLRSLVTQLILPEKMVAFYQQLFVIQQSARQIIKTPLAEKFHHIMIQTTTKDSSIVAKLNSSPFIVT
jgi:hypothetical protein